VFHGKSVENPKAEQARAIFQFKFPARSRISLLVYFNSAEDATFSRGTQSSYSGSEETKDADSFQKMMQSPDVSLWKDVYSSDQSCMWRDRQSRRYGNSFDLFELHQYSSATGEGLPVFDADEDGTDEVHVTNAANGWFSSKTKVKAEETTKSTDAVSSNASNASNAPKTLKTPTSNTPNNDQVPSGLLPNETKWLYTAMDLSITSGSPKWFYFVVANCLPSKEITEKELQSGISEDPMYDVVGDQLACGLTGQTFCQGPLDKIWYDVSFVNGPSHVSYNDEWIKTVRSTMVWIYSVLTIVVLSHVVRLSKLKKLHHTLKILLASVFMSFLGHILGVSYWNIVEAGTIINRDQKGNQQVHAIQWPDTIRVAASLFDLIGHVLLLLLLILIAKGWTITRRKISAMGRVSIFYIHMFERMFLFFVFVLFFFKKDFNRLFSSNMVTTTGTSSNLHNHVHLYLRVRIRLVDLGVRSSIGDVFVFITTGCLGTIDSNCICYLVPVRQLDNFSQQSSKP
jgi:hypothetical protein